MWRGIEAPVLALVVFVAVEAAAGNPLAVDEFSFVDGGDADLRTG